MLHVTDVEKSMPYHLVYAAGIGDLRETLRDGANEAERKARRAAIAQHPGFGQSTSNRIDEGPASIPAIVAD
jgi:hypothetical protein